VEGILSGAPWFSSLGTGYVSGRDKSGVTRMARSKSAVEALCSTHVVVSYSVDPLGVDGGIPGTYLTTRADSAIVARTKNAYSSI